MKSVDRVLAFTAGGLGLLVFVITLQGYKAGHTWEIPIGIAALVVGLVCASFITYRGHH